MFVVKSFDSMVKNSYSFCADSVNIRIPGPPNLGRRDINLPSVPEQFTPPVIGGMNSVLMTLSNCLSWGFDVQYCPHEIGLCLNPLLKPEYTA